MKTLLVLLLGCQTIGLFAQSEIRWPSDTAQAQEMMVLYSDALRNKRYADGIEPFRWLRQAAPDLSKSLYIKGEKLYDGLIEQTTDPKLKRKYQQEALQLYDLRIEHFGEEAAVLNRKAHAAYRYFHQDSTQYATLFSLFDQVFAQGQSTLSSSNLLAYMDVIRLFRRAGGQLSDEEVLLRYDQITQQLQQRSEQEKQGVVDKLLAATIPLNCDLVDRKFGVPFRRDTTDVEKARQIIALGLAYGCKELPVFLVAAQTVQQHQPTVGMAKTMALMYEAQGNLLLAERYYQEAVNLAEDLPVRAELYYRMAHYYQRSGRKTEARNAVQQALRNNPDLKEAYRLIGDLYMDSYDVCKEGKQQTVDRAVFWAAYEIYQRADRLDLMKQAQQQFPSIDVIFQEGYEEGQTIRVGCWINVLVKIQRRSATE